MITPTADSYFTVKVTNEALDVITSKLSPRNATDIKSITLVSKAFKNDISCQTALDTQIDILSALLGETPLDKVIVFNPLYLPNKELDESFEISDNRNITFVAVDGNPYTIKLVDILDDEKRQISGKVIFDNFILPTYNEIINQQKCSIH